MNLPGHEIHDVTYGYGVLVVPVGRVRWLAWFSGKSWPLRLTYWRGFHNISSTGVR